MGPYHIIDLTNPYQWIEYVMSGRAVICLFLFALSYAFLFSLGPCSVFWPLERIFNWRLQINKPAGNEAKFILWLFKVCKIIHYDKPCRKMVAGENIDLFSKLVLDLSDETEGAIIPEFKDTLVNQVWKLCFAFAIAYFFYFKHTWTINISLGLALCFIPAYYVLLSKLYRIVVRAKPNLLRDIENLRVMERICTGLLSAGTPIEFESSGLPPTEYITIGGRKHLLKLQICSLAPNGHLILSFISEGQKKKMPVVLLVNQDLTEEGAKMVADSSQEILVVKVTGDSDMKTILLNRAVEIRRQKAFSAVPANSNN